MNKRKQLPVALTIAGSDSGGGAGIQADLKTFAALGVHGASAIACLTAQNPRRVLGVEPCPPKMLRMQIEAVFEELKPAAVKTGMLFSAENVRVVADFLVGRGYRRAGSRGRPPHLNQTPLLVIDPVLVSTSGAKLLEPAAMKILKEKLLPLATLVTPNLDEAEILTGRRPASIEEMREAAREIHSRFGCAALVKGGHLPAAMKRRSREVGRGVSEAVDIFFDGKTELLLSAPFVKGVRTHGTGCVYSAAICAALALGRDLPRAVEIGKRFVTASISGSYKIGRHFALEFAP
jgi:hydroxymethylpyrimidine/phosphomethylpyrimidine kinase